MRGLRTHRLQRIGVAGSGALVAVGLLLAGPAPLAWAHATGPVPEARVSSKGSEVELVWTAAPDDTATIGAIVGAFPRSVVNAYLEGSDEDLPTADEVARFSRSRELAAYLLDNVAVTQDGTACTGRVEPDDDFVADGARFTFRCPRPVLHAEITISILHDVDPTYRTFSLDGTEQFAMHTADAPTQPWEFGPPSAGGLPNEFLAGAEPALLGLVDRSAGGLLFTVLALLTAAGVGALHAIGPGHGKLLVGAYLAGSQGRARDAVALGGLVGVMHSVSVLALATLLYLTQQVPGGDAFEPALRLLSAVGIVAVGVGLVLRQLRQRQPAPTGRRHGHTGHGHTGHGHTGQTHGHDGAAHHLPAGVAPLSRAGVMALATSGGLLPSPAAFLVLASAFAIGRSGYGLALVAAFSTGLAATLTAVGLAVVSGRRFVDRWAEARPGFHRLSRVMPLASAVAVVLGGLALAGSAVLGFI